MSDCVSGEGEYCEGKGRWASQCHPLQCHGEPGGRSVWESIGQFHFSSPGGTHGTNTHFSSAEYRRTHHTRSPTHTYSYVKLNLRVESKRQRAVFVRKGQLREIGHWWIFLSLAPLLG